MKRILVCITLLVLSGASIAQSSVTTVEHQKMTREAIVNDVPFSEDVIVEAIKDTLQKLGYKGKDSKGFTVYRDVKLPACARVECASPWTTSARVRPRCATCASCPSNVKWVF